MAVHPGTGIAPGDSVIEKVRTRLAGWRIPDEVFQPSLVHRLDKETSGVLLIAKSGPALRALTRSLREGGFEKQYLALAEGFPESARGTPGRPPGAGGQPCGRRQGRSFGGPGKGRVHALSHGKSHREF